MSVVPPMNPGYGTISFRASDLARRAIDRAASTDVDVLSSIFTSFDASRIEAEAQALDGDGVRSKGPLAGLLVSIKDLFDEEGFTTTAGSAVLAGSAPAQKDAEAVRRLKAAGAIPCGRTTMSEFAYSGVGLNPHFGNPGNSLDPLRIAGGSTSGGGLSVALGIADVALGSDTGGSVRIPAAVNGLCGFKPTQSTVPLDGAFPLSATYDSLGPVARTIGECAAVHAVLSGTSPDSNQVIEKPRIGVVRGLLTDGLDVQVARDLDIALRKLSDAGCTLEDIELPMLEGFGNVNRIIVATEAHAIHRDRLEALETAGDPRVLKRIRAFETFSEKDIADAYAQRARAVEAFAEVAQRFDAFVTPTLPVVAPLTSEVEADFDRLNALLLRNPSAVNFLDGCAATVPMHGKQALATGLMIFGAAGHDWRILAIAQRAEAVLS
jgi:aspartyl-tRNA(Asn)/glutamyl-tRNA(Gln) amidotransferase subunit A